MKHPFNRSAHADTQQRVAAARRMLCAVGLQRKAHGYPVCLPNRLSVQASVHQGTGAFEQNQVTALMHAARAAIYSIAPTCLVARSQDLSDLVP